MFVMCRMPLGSAISDSMSVACAAGAYRCFLSLPCRSCCCLRVRAATLLPAHMFVLYKFSIPLSWSAFETLQCSIAD